MEKQNIWERLHRNFCNFLCYLTSDLKWYWIDVIIDTLCYFEMNLKLCKDKEFRDNLYSGDVSISKEHESWCSSQIPKNTFYCERCPFYAKSNIANFFYGEQMDGYCYYLNRGDFTFGHPTDILWDGCKCCDMFEDIPEDELDYDNYDLNV